MVESFETNFSGSSYSDLFDLFDFVIKLINIPNFYLLCVRVFCYVTFFKF